MKIYKYELDITDSQQIPTGQSLALPISVAEQNGKLMLWAVVSGEVGNYHINVDIVGTGNKFVMDKKYIGTVIMPYGLVWHVFAEVEIVVGAIEAEEI